MTGCEKMDRENSSRYYNLHIIGQMTIQGKGTKMHFNDQEAKVSMAELLYP
jgi:hypothetical protein